MGVTRCKGRRDCEKNKGLTGISLLGETVWLRRAILATDGVVVGCVVRVRGGRRFASAANGLLVFFFLGCLYFLFIEEEWLAHARLRPGMVASQARRGREGRKREVKRVICTYHRLPSVQRSRPAEGVPSSAPPPVDEPSSQTNTWPERSKSRSVGVKRRVISGKRPRRTASNIRWASLALRISDTGGVRG